MGSVLIQAEPTEMSGQALSHCGQGPSPSPAHRFGHTLSDQPPPVSQSLVLPKSMPSPACVVVGSCLSRAEKHFGDIWKDVCHS